MGVKTDHYNFCLLVVCILGMLKNYARYTTRYKMMFDASRMQPYPKNSKILLRIRMRTQNRPYHK